MFYIAQGGSKLYKMTTAGVATELTLPAGVTLSTTNRPRFAILGRVVALVNSPSKNLGIYPDGTVRPMAYRGPSSSALVAAGSGTGLTGAYRVWVAFRVRDSVSGKLVAESPLSPASAAVTLANKDLAVTGIPVSPDVEVTSRVIYRSSAGGQLPFEWLEVDGNVATSVTGSDSDEALLTLPEDPSVGIPPGTVDGFRLELVTSWRNRLWAKATDPNKVDTVLYSDEEKVFHWNVDNYLKIKPIGQDERGVTAFMARRDELGIGKRDILAKVVGIDETDFEVVTVVVGVGPVSQESCVVIEDIAYFLGEDGVYTWNASGVKSISKDLVHPWFTTDDYFNRAQFENATARYNPKLHAYELGLAFAGSSSIDRWVTYTIRDGKWWGPHKTGALTLQYAANLEDGSDQAMPVFCGADGIVYKPQAAFTDGASTAIDFDVDTKFFSGDAPDITHYWGELSMLSRILASGTLTITPKVGGFDAAAGATIAHTMTTGRERLRRLGVGRLAQLNFRQNTNAIGCQIYGFELPWHEIGRR
jgi:hypothetical protein